jgi:flagella basal body P-ring formation protein FlgA
LERPGRPLQRDEVEAPLRGALAEAGAGTDLDLELPGFSPPIVALETTVPVTVEQLNYDAPSGRFSAVLGLGGDPTAPQHLRVAGRVLQTTEVMVPVRRLNAGTVLSADDMAPSRVRTNVLLGEPVRTPQQAIGMALRHPVMAGQPLLVAELERPMLVMRGARVTMLLDVPGLSVVAQGQAMEAGAAGSQIQVLNPISRAVVVGQVTGPDTVRVAPGSVPLQPGQRNAPLPAVMQ